MSTKNVTITVAGNVVATAGFINWTQGTNMTYTVSVDVNTDYISVSEAASSGGAGTSFLNQVEFAGNLA